MANAEAYAQWIVANPDKRGTPEFDTVAQAYRAARESIPEPRTLASEAMGSIPAQVAMGALRGAGSIGSTALGLTVDPLARATGIDKTGFGEFFGLGKTMAERRSGMDEALQGMGADTSGLSFGAGKLGAEIAGTSGVGGLLSKLAPAGSAIANALRTGGMTTGAAPANFLSKAGLSDMALRTAAAGTVGGASAGLTGDSVGTGATIGAMMPGAFKAAGAVGGKVGGFFRGPEVAPETMAAAQKAREMGLVMPPSQVKPSFVNRLLEGYAGKQTTQQNASAKNAAIFNEIAAKELGLPPGSTLSPEVLADLRKVAGESYKNVGDMPGRESVAESLRVLENAIAKAQSEKTSALQIAGKLKTMQAQQANLAHGRDIPLSKAQPEFQPYYNPGTDGRVAASPSSNPVPGLPRMPGRYTHNIERAQEGAQGADEAMAVYRAKRAEEELAAKALEDFKSKASGYATQDAITPRQMVFDLRKARNDADSWYKAYQRTADPTALEKARAAKALATNLENSLVGHAEEIGRPDLVEAMLDARKLIAKTYSVENALNKVTGTVDARKLAEQIQRKKPLTGGLRDIGEFAARFEKSAQTPERMGSLPQTSPLDWGFGGAASIAHGNAMPLLATLLGRPIARNTVLGEALQNRMVSPQETSRFIELLRQPAAEQLMYRTLPIAQ